MIKKNLYLVVNNVEDMEAWRVWTKEELLDPELDPDNGLIFKIEIKEEYEVKETRTLKEK